jgi:P27 family predicted phage terminase small subunit
VELRVLHGGAAERARAGVPRPERKRPACPKRLQGEARKLWNLKARELFEAGLLTVLDAPALERWVVITLRLRNAEEKVAELGPVVKTVAGNLITNPFLAVANRCIEQLGKLEAEFGMTPSSRTRVRADPPQTAQAVRARPARPGPDSQDDPRRVLGGV